jgi:hypothetical protein
VPSIENSRRAEVVPRNSFTRAQRPWDESRSGSRLPPPDQPAASEDHGECWADHGEWPLQAPGWLL